MAIANETSEISDNYAAQLAMPKNDNLLEAVIRKQRKEMCLQIPVRTDRRSDVPDEFAPFLLPASGKDDNDRILVFGDATMKNLINLSNTWLVDGTFKMSAENFFQIYTIHLQLHGFAPLCVYVLLPNKTEKTCYRKIELLSEERNSNPGKKTGRLRKGGVECFLQKNHPRRNLVLLFPPDAIL